jgi:hypothetical protein
MFNSGKVMYRAAFPKLCSPRCEEMFREKYGNQKYHNFLLNLNLTFSNDS